MELFRKIIKNSIEHRSDILIQAGITVSANSCVTGAAHSYLFKQYCSGDRSIIAAGFIRKPAALIKKMCGCSGKYM